MIDQKTEFFARTPRHWLASAPLAAAARQPQHDLAPAQQQRTHADNGLVCYGITVTDSLTEILFNALPDYLHIPAARQEPRLRAMLQAVLADPGHHWNVARLAAEACLSRSAFAERCQQVTGYSPGGLVAELRLQRARQLLLQTDQQIEQIALASGYQSATAFIRFFRQHQGLSPGAYREAH